MPRLFDGKCLKCSAMTVLHGRCQRCGYQSLDIRSTPGLDDITNSIDSPNIERVPDASSNENTPDRSTESNDSDDQDGTSSTSSGSE